MDALRQRGEVRPHRAALRRCCRAESRAARCCRAEPAPQHAAAQEMSATGFSPIMLDVDWLELLRGAWTARRSWTPLGSSTELVTLSVRSALDLFLRAQSYPPGSVALVSALTIPDMARVLEHHGLRVVAVDIEQGSLGVSPELLAELLSVHSPVCFVAAQLYGRINCLDAAAALCEAHGCALIEDLAESWCGADYLGHPNADLVCWSQ